ncbi:hypothetical protein B10312_05500 [Campylobacter jejuni]|nr:hypothetical protein B10312_05500 [Campylobacter jejuni]
MENICQFIIENIDKNSLNIKKIKLVFNMQEQEITTISKIFKVSSEHIIAFYDTSTSFLIILAKLPEYVLLAKKLSLKEKKMKF